MKLRVIPLGKHTWLVLERENTGFHIDEMITYAGHN